MEIAFAARVKLCSALSWLSPAFEAESVSPNGASHLRPQSLRASPPGRFCDHHPGPGRLHLILWPSL